jgi:hypothetical protein
VARRALYDTVYYHKTVRSAEGMIGLLLRRLKDVVAAKGWVFGNPTFFQPYQAVVSGKPLRPEEILGLDDYSLWVLIQQLSSQPEHDVTLADLAGRIVARVLFKMVPSSSGRLEEFIRKHDAYARIHRAVRPFVSGDETYYAYIDSATIQMFCDKPREDAYFVDMDTEVRLAVPIKDHLHLRPHWQKPETLNRLFVPREAVEDVTKLVEAG